MTVGRGILMNEKSLEELALVAMECLKNKREAIDIVRWASVKDTRANKMIDYLKNNPDASIAKARYEMCKIVADELL